MTSMGSNLSKNRQNIFLAMFKTVLKQNESESGNKFAKLRSFFRVLIYVGRNLTLLVNRPVSPLPCRFGQNLPGFQKAMKISSLTITIDDEKWTIPHPKT